MYYYTLKYRDIKLGVPDWVVSRILCKIGDRGILPFFTSVDKGNQDVIIGKLFGREDDYRC